MAKKPVKSKAKPRATKTAKSTPRAAKKPAPASKKTKPVPTKRPKRPTTAAKAAGNAGATTSAETWRSALRDELAKLPDDFAAFCRDVGAKVPEGDAWPHCDTDELKGLEAWARELATRDRTLGVAAACALAQTGFPLAMATAGTQADSMGFHADEPHADGAPVGAQIARAAAWLDAPGKATLAEVRAGFDPTRQLVAWSEDLIDGANDQPWFWYIEVGQCLACAIMNDEREPHDVDAEDSTYEHWSPALCVARGMVMATRGLRGSEGDGPTLATLYAGMQR